MLTNQTACQLVETAADAVQSDADRFREFLDGIPAPIYVTDAAGTISYFNPPCVELAGRTPTVGRDKWCVTWKLYTADGEPLPHDECPLAVTLRDRKPVRDVEALAERPDGTMFRFVPFPMPLFDAAGELSGAVNLLMDVSGQRSPAYLEEQAAQCRRLAAVSSDRTIAKSMLRIADKYEEQSRKLARHD
jgi:PAS domain-containing protein